LIHPFRSWSAVSLVTIAAAGKQSALGIMHRATGDVMVVGIHELKKNYFHFFLLFSLDAY
jgi:hypothetical protein